ncbi:hypothetical protein MMC28_009230 [Mycoblastus sanguinarius]|nr:hypothetical protein [Mycoblastus sanguinarius]
MLRSLNSIYLQAPHVKAPTDIKDFLFYCSCWYEMVEHHHHVEEEYFFPTIERIAHKPGLMEVNVEQHESFHPGFYRFRDYVRNTNPDDFDGELLQGIMDGFSPILQQHLKEEIGTLLELKDCDEEQLRACYKILEEKVLDCDKSTVYPFVMGTVDWTYEGGMHRGLFPPVPFFMPYLIKYWYERRYGGCWRFSPCDGFGNPRPLLFLE